MYSLEKNKYKKLICRSFKGVNSSDSEIIALLFINMPTKIQSGRRKEDKLLDRKSSLRKMIWWKKLLKALMAPSGRDENVTFTEKGRQLFLNNRK